MSHLGRVLRHRTLLLVAESITHAAERVCNRFKSGRNALPLLVGLRSSLVLYLVNHLPCRLFRRVNHLPCCLFRRINNPAISAGAPGRAALCG